MQVIERIEEHYEVQEVPFGRSYKWCPECVTVECDCGERPSFKMSVLTDSAAVCECGTDLTTNIQEKLQGHLPEVQGRAPEDYEASHHPWHHDARAQAKQHKQDEAAYPKDSPWRYDDITSRGTVDERNAQ